MKTLLLEYREKYPKDKSIKDESINKELDKLFLDIDFGDSSVNKIRKMKSSLVLLDFSEPPKCYCGNELEFVSADKATHKTVFGGWREFCSKKCSLSSPTVVDRRKKTNIERFGVDSWAKTEAGKKTSSGKWDQDKKDAYNEKSKKTFIEKYGVDHYSKTEEYLEKRSKTCLEKYGVENCFQDVDNIKQKSLEKNGYYGWFSSEEGKHYIENNNPAYLEETKDKKRLSYYNNRIFVHQEFNDIIYNKDKERFQDFIHKVAKEQGNHRRQISNYIGISYSNLNYFMRKFDMETEYLNLGKGSSFAEIEVYNFVKELVPDAIRGDRTILKPKELDVYIPSKQLAIEYNGIYSHSVYLGGKDEGYHLYKTNECEKQGIQLLHIFDWEWNDPIKQEIWKSIIRNKLGLTETKIPARKCKFVLLDYKQVYNFFEQNHLSGAKESSFYYGLIYENELVSCMSILFEKEKKKFHISRFASKKDTIVMGALGKFIKNINVDNLSTFANRRYSSIDNSCYKHFFNTMRITEVNYYGFSRKYQIPLSRWNYTKEECKKLFSYDENKSWENNLFDNGYDIIYDSGNLCFEGLKY